VTLSLIVIFLFALFCRERTGPQQRGGPGGPKIGKSSVVLILSSKSPIVRDALTSVAEPELKES
jgi:hypothetical protein